MNQKTRAALGALVNAIALDDTLDAESRKALCNQAMDLDDDDQADEDVHKHLLDSMEEDEEDATAGEDLNEAYRPRRGRLTVQNFLDGFNDKR